ncbi:hypothetical protein BU15DRAFT_90710 [Melanogaster broomeanus]|nr:hypothetical protein BU15DRAFT_90710 [Melanogaster broomeanus]
MKASTDRSGVRNMRENIPRRVIVILQPSIFNKPVMNETLTKVDRSPVTVADYSTQAVINMILRHALLDGWCVGRDDIIDIHVFRLVDAWTMGLLRSGQYAVCLALIVDGEVVLGIIGSPNLPVNNAEPHGSKGCMFVAVAAQGAEQAATTLSGTNPTSLTIPLVAPGTLNLLGSVEAAYSDLAFNNRVSEVLSITRAATQMDSQAKCYCPARGDGGVYVRMLTRARYKEKICDNAPGTVLPLDFGPGRNLGENYGVLAAVQNAQAEEKERA